MEVGLFVALLTNLVAFGATNPRKHGTAEIVYENGTETCPLNCDHGTILYPDNTCRCICKKNFALVQDERCVKAAWSSWNSWSECLKSDWGGLQRRERVCLIEGYESPGACDGRGSMRRTCSSITKEFRIRKNIKDLSDEELHDLLQAMTKFKKDKSKKGYRNIASWHGYPGRCPWYNDLNHHDDNHCSWHVNPMFQTWHRLITVQFELGLSRYLKNKTMGIPFWDWTEESTELPYLIRNPEIYDPILKKFIANPFFRTFIRNIEGIDRYSIRISGDGLFLSHFLLRGSVRATFIRNFYENYRQTAGVPHNQIHSCFCVADVVLDDKNPCLFGLVSTLYAAWDPVFLLHHSAMDRLLVIRMKLDEQNGISDWTRSRVIGQYEPMGSGRDITEAFDWPLSPFCNNTMNPESVTGKEQVWTMHNAYYNEELFGYKYDNFDFGHDYKWDDFQRDFKRNVMDRKFWNDDYFMTKLGELTEQNSQNLGVDIECVNNEPNHTHWHMSIKWN